MYFSEIYLILNHNGLLSHNELCYNLLILLLDLSLLLSASRKADTLSSDIKLDFVWLLSQNTIKKHVSYRVCTNSYINIHCGFDLNLIDFNFES
jgi:hypothetical protein